MRFFSSSYYVLYVRNDDDVIVNDDVHVRYHVTVWNKNMCVETHTHGESELIKGEKSGENGE